MAEIKIEQKKQIWPWLVIGFIIVAVIVFFMVFNNNGKKAENLTEVVKITTTNEPAPAVVKVNNSTVSAYVNYIENTMKEMSLNHAYSNEALIKLTDATNAMANEVGYEVGADLEKVKEYAEMITEDPYDTTHADNIRKSADILTNVLQNIQKVRFLDLSNEVEELRSAAESIKPEVLTLKQKDAVMNYFAKASGLLKKMND